jgi:hypothetical protein
MGWQADLQPASQEGRGRRNGVGLSAGAGRSACVAGLNRVSESGSGTFPPHPPLYTSFLPTYGPVTWYGYGCTILHYRGDNPVCDGDLLLKRGNGFGGSRVTAYWSPGDMLFSFPTKCHGSVGARGAAPCTRGCLKRARDSRSKRDEVRYRMTPPKLVTRRAATAESSPKTRVQDEEERVLAI